jgi:hypothetical protein
VAIGPRVWGYEAGLLLPILIWAIAGGLTEPWRTRLVFLAIPMGLFWLVSAYTIVSGVAVVVVAATAMWLWRWRPFGPEPAPVSAATPAPSGSAAAPGSRAGAALSGRAPQADAA